MPEVVTPLTSVDIKSRERLLQDKVAEKMGYFADRTAHV